MINDEGKIYRCEDIRMAREVRQETDKNRESCESERYSRLTGVAEITNQVFGREVPIS